MHRLERPPCDEAQGDPRDQKARFLVAAGDMKRDGPHHDDQQHLNERSRIALWIDDLAHDTSSARTLRPAFCPNPPGVDLSSTSKGRSTPIRRTHAGTSKSTCTSGFAASCNDRVPPSITQGGLGTGPGLKDGLA